MMLPQEPLQIDTDTPFIIAGLGNPGREYRLNRHNIGFMAVDHIAQKMGFVSTKVQNKAIVRAGLFDQCRIILAKPQTYMNLSGQAVAGLLRFYKISHNHLMVIHDDLDLPFGTIRIRSEGGAGGQKGMTSIIQQLGTNRFSRIRLGIGRPPGQMDPADYVLQNFDKAEYELLMELLDRSFEAVKTWMKSGIATAMNQYNGSLLKE